MSSSFAISRRTIVRLSAIAALFVVAACGNDPSAPSAGNGDIPEDSLPTDTVVTTPKPVAVVEVGVDGTVEVPAGEQRHLRAVLRSADGSILAGRQVQWSVSDESRAFVSGDGVVTTREVGNVTVFATSEGRSGSTTLVVTAPEVARIELHQLEATLESGYAMELGATVFGADGRVLQREIAWTSEDESKVDVIQGNEVIAVRGGDVALVARSGNATARMVIHVPLAREYAIAKINGKALPQAFDERTVTDSMINETTRLIVQLRRVVTGGTLVLSTVDSTYRQVVHIKEYESRTTIMNGNTIHGPTRVTESTFNDRGTYDWHLFLGTPILQSDRFLVEPVTTQPNAAGDYRRGLLALIRIPGTQAFVDFEFTR